MMKKIVVYIITYNQEDTISRALDSVLCQKEWGLYKVIVSDDCSKDGTWNILSEYQAKHPDIIVPHRNEHNLGIYGNMEIVESLLPEGDLYCGLSGDDEYCDGYFEAIQKYIEDNDVDTSGAIGIYSNWKDVFPDGKEVLHSQHYVQSGYPLFSLKIRGFICGRSLMKSAKVQKAYGPMIHGSGLNLAESYHDAQPHLHIEKAYYIPQVTTKYNRGVGISSRLSIKKSDYATKQAIEAWTFMKENYIEGERDIHYANFELGKARFFMKPTWKGYMEMLLDYFRGELPDCRNPFSKSVRMFVGLAKYKFSFRPNNR